MLNKLLNKRTFKYLFSTIWVISIFLSEGSNLIAQEKNLKEIRKAAEERYLTKTGRKIERHKGNYRVRINEVIRGDLVITDGDVEIEGRVSGTVIVINGDIELGRRGEITGDAISVSGDIIKKSGSIISGDEIQTSWRSFIQRSERDERRRWQRQRGGNVKNWSYDDELFDEDAIFRYNRVEGVFFGLKLDRENYYGDAPLNVYGHAGYGFKNDEWRYMLGVERNFFYENQMSLGAKIYDLTDSDDYWRMSSTLR